MARDKDRIRVLVGSPTYLPRQGGASTYFSNLMKKLSDRVDFTVYSCVDPDAPKHLSLIHI
jgi:hypothetical protein